MIEILAQMGVSTYGKRRVQGHNLQDWLVLALKLSLVLQFLSSLSTEFPSPGFPQLYLTLSYLRPPIFHSILASPIPLPPPPAAAFISVRFKTRSYGLHREVDLNLWSLNPKTSTKRDEQSLNAHCPKNRPSKSKQQILQYNYHIRDQAQRNRRESVEITAKHPSPHLPTQ